MNNIIELNQKEISHVAGTNYSRHNNYSNYSNYSNNTVRKLANFLVISGVLLSLGSFFGAAAGALGTAYGINKSDGFSFFMTDILVKLNLTKNKKRE